jgi:putative tryptophan/tyrosine transport system substrate-binding protein
MKAKVLIYALPVLILATLHLAEAQQAKKIPRVGVLLGGKPPSASTRLEAFRQGLRGLGWVEGQTIAIDVRYAEGKRDRMRELATELARLKPDVIVAVATNAVLAVKQVTTTVPIVTPQVGDPVAGGFVASLARPGGNVTGLTQLSPELSGKRLEFLKEAIPNVSRVAVLWNPDSPGSVLTFKGTEIAARALGLQLQSVEVRRSDDFDKGLSAVIEQHANALVFVRAALTGFHQKRVLDFALKNRLPAIYDGKELVESGGLMSYGVDFADLWRRAATYVDKILKGARPGELPVEQPTKFELVINLKTAKQLDLTIPPEVLYRADKVIK